MPRSVNEEKLVEKVGDLTDLDERAEKALRDYLRRQPKAPALVSRSGAAKILEVAVPHIDRLDMPEPIEIEGGWKVYLKADVIDLRDRLAAEKAEREKAAAAAV